MTEKKVKECRLADLIKLRSYCIKNGYYDEGTNEEYENLFRHATTKNLSGQDIYELAKDICTHSSSLDEDDEDVLGQVMYDLVDKNVIYSLFFIHDKD